MNRSALSLKTKQELLQIAKDTNITGYSKLTKDELVEVLVKHTKKTQEITTPDNRKSRITTYERSETMATATKGSRNKEEDYKDASERSKFYVGEGIREPYYEDHFTFPAEYGRTKIVLMVRDPYWVHAYWEITFSKIEEIKKLIGENVLKSSKLVLRVKNVTNASADKPNSFFDIDVVPGANNWYINVPNDCANYVVDIGYKTPDGNFIIVARSNEVGVPRAGVSDQYDEEYISLEQLDKIYALSGGLQIGLSSGEIRQRMKELIEQSTSSGAITSPGVSSISSGFMKKEKKERGFFLVVNTELIVYGATVPDATLTIQGQPKKLNPDGTFSARFALPDGLQEIPVKAISSDKIDEITITPIVSKKTV